MAKKRKKKPQTPRCWRMKREQRLQSAKTWLPTYKGKNIVKGYRKKYRVDIMCAIGELQMLGIEFTPEYIESVKRSIAAHQKKKQEKKQAKLAQEEFSDYGKLFGSDENFAFIAGYTSGGAPYGLTWEQWDEIKKENSVDHENR